MEEAQKELEEKGDSRSRRRRGGSDGFGKKEITKVKLSEEVVDPDDIEMLEDLIMAATNEALPQMEEMAQSSMAKITGGLGGRTSFLREAYHGILQQTDQPSDLRASTLPGIGAKSAQRLAFPMFCICPRRRWNASEAKGGRPKTSITAGVLYADGQ